MKTLYMLVGAPGSGKTYYAKNNLINDNCKYVSRDDVRFEIIKDDEEYFAHENKVYKEFIHRIKTALKDSDVIADATHLNWASRRKLINAIGMNDIDIIPIVLNTDIKTTIKQNKMRTGRSVVPDKVIYQMKARMTDPATDPFEYKEVIYI